MKKYILYVLLVMLAFTSCIDRLDIPMGEPSLVKQSATVTSDRISFQGTFSSTPTIEKVYVRISLYGNLSPYVDNELRLKGHSFEGEIDYLQENTQYYYQYVFVTKFEGKQFVTHIMSCKTKEDNGGGGSGNGGNGGGETPTATLPTLGTVSISNITTNSATVSCSVTNDGNATVTERGIDFATTANPTYNTKKASSGGTGAYSVTLSGLSASTTYYVRAYAKNSAGIAYSTVKSFTTTAATLTSEGRLSGMFSISATQKVRFSKGNLQYQASTKKWRFAENQWDIVGMGYGETDESNLCYVGGTVPNSNNLLISDTYDGWIDLFGWGTGDEPTKVSYTETDYENFTDWGTNAIANGGNARNQWRTLTVDEWTYLIKTRTDAKTKQGAACVNGVTGAVFLPDNWTQPSGVTFTSGYVAFDEDLSYLEEYQLYATINNYTSAQWQKMEAAGAIFLPAAGDSSGRNSALRILWAGIKGDYWSSSRDYETGSSSDSNLYAKILRIYCFHSYISWESLSQRSPVRLVQDVK